MWIARGRRRFQILHSHSLYSPSTIGCLSRRFFGLPLVAKVACSGRFGEIFLIRRQPISSLRRRILRSAACFAVMNRESVEELRSFGLGGVPWRKMRNGVPVGVFRPGRRRRSLREALRFDPAAWLLLFVGRLAEQKRVDVLLRAWRRLRERPSSRPRRLLIGGDGPEEASLKSLAEELGVASSVSFLGRVKELAPLYGAVDAFVLPSGAEGLSNSLLEAASSGLPIVATDIPGNREIVEEGKTGLLVPPGDVEAMAAAILRIAEEGPHARMMGRAARRVVEERYSIGSVASSYISLYGEILDRGGG